jgi:hypothetical protein
MHANTQCKKNINEFCITNTTTPNCKCWNVNSEMYNKDECKYLRAIFTGKLEANENLTAEQLAFFKKKYNLLETTECPKPIPPVCNSKTKDLEQSSHDMYDWDNIKISLDGYSKSPYQVDNLYKNEIPGVALVAPKAAAKVAQTAPAQREDPLPEDPIKVENPFGAPGAPKAAPKAAPAQPEDPIKVENPYGAPGAPGAPKAPPPAPFKIENPYATKPAQATPFKFEAEMIAPVPAPVQTGFFSTLLSFIK